VETDSIKRQTGGATASQSKENPVTGEERKINVVRKGHEWNKAIENTGVQTNDNKE